METKSAKLWLLNDVGNTAREIKLSTKHPFDLTGQQEKFRFISCYQLNESMVLRKGKIYTCPIIPYSEHYNKRFDQNLHVTEDCYIDIYKAKSYEEIAEFLTHRTSFCNYCAVHKRYEMPWKQSEHTIDEWTL